MSTERVGIYKTRKLTGGELVIHVPPEHPGDYVLFVEEDGTLRYAPVKV
jgi:hypothetical protein